MSVNTIYRNAGYMDKTVIFHHGGQDVSVDIMVPSGPHSTVSLVEHAWDTIASFTVAPAKVSASGKVTRKVTLTHGAQSLSVKVEVRSDLANDDEVAIENAYSYIGMITVKD